MKGKEDVVRRFVKAFKESIEYVKEHREVWPEIAKRVGIKTEWGRNTIYDRVAPSFIARWDKKYIQEQLSFIETVRNTFGGKIKGIPAKYPDEAWNFKFAP